ncbi:PrsW family intramembrane metalloprotease [candidate division WOR-3 bacterium]|nr:PrsW family intramembrane metalloprotease [candidate division WOR-3 bacterium]
MGIIVLALGPVVAIFFFFWAKDRYEREPLRRLLLTAAIGAAAAIPIVIVEALWGHTITDVSDLTFNELVFMTFVEVGLTEEFFKMLAFLITAYWSRHMNEPYDGIMYAVSASLGFAAIENVLYVFGGGVGTGILRAITAIPGHAMFGLFIGYFAGRAKFAKTSGFAKFLLIMIGFVISSSLHGLYDLIAFWSFVEGNLGFLFIFPLLGIMVTVSLLLIRDARKRSPFRPAKDAYGHYTGYTVSGEPLPPKLAAKLKIDMSHIYEPQGLGASNLFTSKKDQAARPYFLDEYLQRDTKDIPTAVDDSEIKEIPTGGKEPETWPGADGSEDASPFLRDYYNRKGKN